MPTPLKRSENMRKHLTKSERESRQGAESSLQRERRPYIQAPAWLSEEARAVFEETKRKLRTLQLLDTSDAELLAMYSDAIAQYQNAIKQMAKQPADPKEIQAAQSWSRLALQYAEKLGISPTARARLAKRKAERQELDPMERLLDDVTEFVNGGQ